MLVIAGQAAAVFHLPGGEREGVGDGVPHPLHQGHRWAPGPRGAAGRAQEWTGNIPVGQLC